jgi:ferredoxin
VSSLRERIRIDRALCEGSGVCAFQAPATFDLDDEAKVVLLDEGDDTDSDEAIRVAVESCPTHAITIDELDT